MENTPKKSGRKPISEKATPADGYLTADAVFGNQGAIPPEVQAELKEQGLIGRWLNAQTVHQNQGYHKKGWQVYRRKKNDTIKSEWSYGSDPSGIVRRGDSILGVKTTEQVKLHRKYLEQRNKKMSLKASDKAKAGELRAQTAAAGLNTTVRDGGADD